MIIGIPRETAQDEKRVGLSPAQVQTLIGQGRDVIVERGAGTGSGFDDQRYADAGAQLVSGPGEVWQRSGLVVKVNAPSDEECGRTVPGQIILAFWDLHIRDRRVAESLMERGCTLLDYGTIQDDDGRLPVLTQMSQIAGRMVPQIAARFLQSDHGGSGILLGGLPAVPPAEVVILGGGTVGRNAARAFLSAGARVSLLDDDLDHLRELHGLFEGLVTTYLANAFNLPKVLGFADVTIGAVRDPRGRAPRIVTREMVAGMRDGSVIIDLSIDQGGCFATSRPTRLGDPAYTVDGVTHFCVPNLPSLVARTATYALGNATARPVARLAAGDLRGTLRDDAALRRGTVMFEGKVTDPRLLTAHDLPGDDLDALIGGGNG